MGLVALAHHSAGRIAEIGFLLMAAAGVIFALSAVGVVRGRGGNAVAGVILAVAGLALIIAFHWGHF